MLPNGITQDTSSLQMHIAFITPEFLKEDKLYPGGLSTYIFTAASGLIGRGHRVTVFLSGHQDRELDFQGIRVLERKKRIPERLSFLHNKLSKWIPQSYDRIMSSWSLRKFIREETARDPVDILHYTNWKAIGLFPAEGNSLIRISSYEKLWDNNPSNDHLDKRLTRKIESMSYAKFCHIIGPGDYLARRIVTDLRLSGTVDILPTPFSPSVGMSDRDFRKPGMKLVVYAGTISRIKGAELLFRIIREYLGRHQDTFFLLAGKSGNINGTGCEKELASLSAKFPKHFAHYPHLDRADLMAAFSQADAVLIPSVVDNFPNTALEAISNGAIVIASDTASLGSLIMDGQNGFILEDREPEEWISTIRKVLFGLGPEKIEKMKLSMKDSLLPHETGHAVEELEKYYTRIITGTYRANMQERKKRMKTRK